MMVKSDSRGLGVKADAPVMRRTVDKPNKPLSSACKSLLQTSQPEGIESCTVGCDE